VEPTESQATWRCAADALGPGETASFALRMRGRTVRAFLLNHEGGHHASVNRCPHAGTTLDAWPNEFFTEDGPLICGTRLERLPVVRRGDELVVGAPA
jgi:nitrite reductase/ring-hydroxylating ferredoxin subunit